MTISAAADRRLRSLRRHRTAASALREAWAAEARAIDPHRPGDWWTPPADALTRAIARHADPRPAGVRFGRARARDGHGIRHTVDDLVTLYRHLPPGRPPNRLMRAAIEAWSEVVLAPTGVTVCGSPRNGTATAEYLHGLLGGLYQFGSESGGPLSDDYLVLIVDVPADSGWEPVTLLLDLGTRLLPVLPAQALLVMLSPGRIGTLVRRVPELTGVVAELTARLPDEGPVGGVILTTEVPEDLPAAHRLLARVSN